MRTILPIKEEPENIPIYSNPSSEKGAAAAVVANLSGNKVLPLHIAGCHLLVLLFKFILLKSRKRLLEILPFFFTLIFHKYIYSGIFFTLTAHELAQAVCIYIAIQGLVHHQLKYKFNLCPHKLILKHWLEVWGWDGTQQVAQAKINYIYVFYKGGNLGDMRKSDYICYLQLVK